MNEREGTGARTFFRTCGGSGREGDTHSHKHIHTPSSSRRLPHVGVSASRREPVTLGEGVYAVPGAGRIESPGVLYTAVDSPTSIVLLFVSRGHQHSNLTTTEQKRTDNEQNRTEHYRTVISCPAQPNGSSLILGTHAHTATMAAAVGKIPHLLVSIAFGSVLSLSLANTLDPFHAFCSVNQRNFLCAYKVTLFSPFRQSRSGRANAHPHHTHHVLVACPLTSSHFNLHV